MNGENSPNLRLSGANVIIAVLIYGRLVGGMLDTVV